MDFNDYPACRSARHYGKGIPATHKVVDNYQAVTYYCWECLCKVQLKLTRHTITQIHPYNTYRECIYHD